MESAGLTFERWPGGEGQCCRLLVGMQRLPREELFSAMSLIRPDEGMDNQSVLRFKRKLAQEFRDQLTIGIPTNEDETGLRRLAGQIRARKVIVRLYLRHPLHAKLYLLFRADPVNPIIGYLGSSNLTFAGLSRQGELNIDVLDYDACEKLSRWFEDRWNDRWCVDISDELLQIIEESWARETPKPPYHIYVKMAYHLSQEARAGLSEFRIPRDFGQKLFDFQTAAVRIAAHHLNRRGGFDAIITNPPWEIFKPQAKEFFAEHHEPFRRSHAPSLARLAFGDGVQERDRCGHSRENAEIPASRRENRGVVEFCIDA